MLTRRILLHKQQNILCDVASCSMRSDFACQGEAYARDGTSFACNCLFLKVVKRIQILM